MIASLHPLAQAWLERLDALSAALPPGPAAELRADLREHLAVALPPDADADAVRAVLRELGEPEDVLREAALAGDAAGGVPGAAAQPEPAPAPRATAPAASEFGAEQPARVRLGWRDVAALILVATAPVTAFMPVVGLLAWVATMVVCCDRPGGRRARRSWCPCW